MRFGNLQAMRGIAALMVLLIHIMQHNYGIDSILYRFWWIGPAGVDLFFVISGFIICYTAVRASRNGEPSYVASGRFAAKRIIRVFPLYWVVLACAWTVSDMVELAPASMPEYSAWRYITLTIIQNSKVMVAWSLAYEIFFYLVLSIIILFRPNDIYKVIGFWVVIQAVAIGISWSLFKYESLQYVFTSPVILEFAAGCGLAYLIDRGVKGGGALSLLYGLLLFSTGAYVNSKLGDYAWSPGWRVILFTPGAALIIYGVIDLENSGAWSMPKWLQKVGDASYSIYIWHQLIVAILVALVNKFQLLNFLPGWALIFCYGLIAIGFGFISYYTIEKPTLKLLGNLVLSKPVKTSEVEITQPIK